MVSCYNARTGEPYYHQTRLPKTYSFKSSPVGANGKLYLASENEDVLVLRMGEKFEVLATNTMTDQIFIATPAIQRRRDLPAEPEPVVLHQREVIFGVRQLAARMVPVSKSCGVGA